MRLDSEFFIYCVCWKFYKMIFFLLVWWNFIFWCKTDKNIKWDGLRHLLKEHHFLYWLHEGLKYDPDWNEFQEVSRTASFTKGLPWGRTRLFRPLARLFFIALKDVVFTTRQLIPLLGHHHSENGSFHTLSEPLFLLVPPASHIPTMHSHKIPGFVFLRIIIRIIESLWLFCP